MISRVLFKAEKTTVITTKSGEPNWLYTIDHFIKAKKFI